MKKTDIKRASLWLVTATLAVSMAVLAMNACKKTDENKSLRISVSGKMVPLEMMPQKMSDLYFNTYHERQWFDSCKIVEQDNGYTIIVAVGTNKDGESIKFATLADKEGDILSLRDTPHSTCTCEGTCNKGCEPKYLGVGYAWDCTSCEYSQLPRPTCVKTITASQPNPGSNQ